MLRALVAIIFRGLIIMHYYLRASASAAVGCYVTSIRNAATMCRREG